ncbi:MAG: hypothetical protein WBA45_04080 [Microthrixaceae bacterium]
MHASLSSRDRLLILAALVITPHPADDPVGEVSFVGSPGLASSLPFGGFPIEV